MEEQPRAWRWSYQALSSSQAGERGSEGWLVFPFVVVGLCRLSWFLGEGDALTHCLQQMPLSTNAIPGALQGVVRKGKADAATQLSQFRVRVQVGVGRSCGRVGPLCSAWRCPADQTDSSWCRRRAWLVRHRCE